MESPRGVACCVDMRAFAVILVAACGREPTPPTVARPLVTHDAAIAVVDASIDPCPVATATLGPGLVVERWHVAAKPAAGEPCIDIVRADPSLYTLRAMTRENGARGAVAWAESFGAIAVTNAGMFHDGGAPVGLVVAQGKSAGVDNQKFGGYLAWDPTSAKSPPVASFGRGCNTLASYQSYVQSYRLLDCNGGAIAWKDPKQYSAAAIGTDQRGHIVFIHARGAFTMHELSTALAAHDLAGAIFLEGGPEASLVVRGKAGSLDRVGSYETGFVENDGNTAFWDLPNVIMLVART